MQYVLALILIIVAIVIIIKYKWFFIAVAVLGIAAYIAIKYFKKKKSDETTESDLGASEHNEKSSEKSQPSTAVTHQTSNTASEHLAEAFSQYESELESIPMVDIPISEPVSRHLLKEMPEYEFSNITRKTRLDSIFPLVFLDVETTGLYPSKHEIVEVSAIKFDVGMVPVACFTTLCKPRNSIPANISAINHITDDMVADAPEFRQIAPALNEFLHGCHISGHNLEFDLRFIFAHGADFPEKVRLYDTLDLAHRTIPSGKIDNYKLDTLCFYYGVWRKKSHSSLSDCYATSKVFSHLVYDKTSRQLKEQRDVVSELDTK